MVFREPCRSPAMTAQLLLQLLLQAAVLTAAQAVLGLLPAFTALPALGADVGAPRFIEANKTWQFELAVSAGPGDLVLPFVGAHAAATPAECAAGPVPLCCLYRLADALARNHELDAYLSYLGPCEALAGAASADVLRDAPPLDALVQGALPGQLRGWCSAPHVCVFEFADAELAALAAPGTRELAVTLAFAGPLVGSPLLLVALAQHTLRFAEASTDAHFAFRHTCEGLPKPPAALWRMGVPDCLWFCRTGFLLQPSTASYFAMPPHSELHTCEAVPHPAVLLEFVLVAGARAPEALQREAASATGLAARDAAFFLMPDNNYTAVLFSRDCKTAADVQLAAAAAALAALPGITVLSARAVSQCPPPLWDATQTQQLALVVWLAAGLLLALAFAACIWHAVHRGRRRRLARRFAPTAAAAGFSVPHAQLQRL